MRGLVVLSLALGIALIPCSLIGQEEEQEEGRDWTGGLVTGGGVGTAASSLAAAGLCASSGYDARTCAADGALYGFLPALASGYGLSYPDRTTWKGRLRTVALGAAGGLLTVLAVRLTADRDLPVYALWSGRGRFRGPALWGTGVGLVSAVCRALRPSSPLSVPRIARSGQRVPARARVGLPLPTSVVLSMRPRREALSDRHSSNLISRGQEAWVPGSPPGLLRPVAEPGDCAPPRAASWPRT